MDPEDFKKHMQRAGAWSADYRSNLRDRKVRSAARPGDFLEALPATPPEDPEEFDKIMTDFETLVPGGLTNWQHPRMFAYFPANSFDESVIAEQLTAAMGVNAMLWQTSPVATEMEIRMLEWLGLMCGLPGDWRGVIQDTASSATLAVMVTARERALERARREKNTAALPSLRFYRSANSHSSVDKALMIAGVEKANIVEVSTLASGSMDPAALQSAIGADREAGLIPAAVAAVVGATSTGVSDDLVSLGDLVRSEGLYGHVDAAWAGSATLCPEHRGLIDGLELWDSYVFNPHKWMGVNFDCSALFVKNSKELENALSMTPHYLRTQYTQDVEMPDFCNWSVPLGRRFRALKLWFVIRSKGVAGLREMVRSHISWAQSAAQRLEAEADFELMLPPQLSLFVFRHLPAQGGADSAAVDEHNSRLLDAINDDGFLYLTQTRYNGSYALRFQVGTTEATEQDIQDSVTRIIDIARGL